jgi:DNA polymerase
MTSSFVVPGSIHIYNRVMASNENIFTELSRAAKQLIDIEILLGSPFVPTERAPLPEIEIPKPVTPELSASEKAEALEKIYVDEIKNCNRCALCQGRTNAVPGEGNPDANLVFVGEGPGRDEDISGKPFVGRAGQLLTKMISAMGLSRDDVFICNVVKCRPPNNRTPMPEEVQACWGYLMRQLAIIRPKAIVTLGNPATQNLLKTKVGITRLRGNWQKLPDVAEGVEDTPVMPTFHPSYVLRQYTADNRAKVWSDLQQVMQLLDIPLPEAK